MGVRALPHQSELGACAGHASKRLGELGRIGFPEDMAAGFVGYHLRRTPHIRNYARGSTSRCLE